MGKITSYVEMTAPAPTDLLVAVDDVGGTPTTKKLSISNLLGNIDTSQALGWSDASISRAAANDFTFGDGAVTLRTSAVNNLTLQASPKIVLKSNATTYELQANNFYPVASGANLGWPGNFRWATLNLESGGNACWGDDLFLYRGGAGILEQRNGANAQESRLAYSYTDGSNYLALVQSWATGIATIGIDAVGTFSSDNVDLALSPVGTGRVRFGSHSAIGAETVTGYIEIKDSGGTTRKLAVVS